LSHHHHKGLCPCFGKESQAKAQKALISSMAAAPLLLGAGFMTMIGAKAARNFLFKDDEEVQQYNGKNNFTRAQDGVVERLVANPRLLEQYNEKYIDKKLLNNNVLRRQGSNKQIQRTRSQEIARRASTRTEKDTHGARAEYIDSKMVGA